MIEKIYTKHFRASGSSYHSSLAGAIANAVRSDDGKDGKPVSVQAIGASATYNALKAAMLANQYLVEDGLMLLLSPRYVMAEVEEDLERTAVRLEFIVVRHDGTPQSNLTAHCQSLESHYRVQKANSLHTKEGSDELPEGSVS